MRVLKFILFLIFILALIVAFLPKKNLYYLLEEELQKEKIAFSGEKIEDKLLYFEIRDAKIFYEDIEAGTLKRARVYPLFFWNMVEIEGISIDSDVARFVPKSTDFLRASHSIINPLKIQIEGVGDFGSLDGGVDILDRRVLLELNASSMMGTQYRNITSKMKQIDGKLVYEQSF